MSFEVLGDIIDKSVVDYGFRLAVMWGTDDVVTVSDLTDEEAAHLDKRPHEVPVIYINSQNTEFSKLLQESKVNSRKDYFRKYWITQMAISALVSVTQDETKQKESVGWARQAYLSSKIAGLIPKEFSL